MTLTAIVVAGAAQYALSAGEFKSLWDGVWWAAVTVTTVGYGDLYPTTVQGRLVGMVLMFVGIGFLSLLTAAVASRFVKQERGEEHNEVMERLGRIEARLVEPSNGRPTEMDVLRAVQDWKVRRKPPLSEGEVARMIRNLNLLGWLDLDPSADLPLPEDALVDELEFPASIARG